jgi:hypothetical protein
VIRPDDLQAGRARAADRREVVGGLDLEARPAAFRVPRPRRILDYLLRAEEQAAALVRKILNGVRDNLIQYPLSYFHSATLSFGGWRRATEGWGTGYVCSSGRFAY